tara:strand:+ start:1009 stop:1821 length:813 start_codon:yes stop_codon:yes gene_type:complete
MKLKSPFINKDKLESQLQPFKHLDFSLFVDDRPQSDKDLSSINILVLSEPNEYFGFHDWAIKNQKYFSVILTWDFKVLNNCNNAAFLPFGHTFLKENQYEKNHTKEFKIAHLCGKLLKTYGHNLRHELLARENELNNPTKFYDVYGNRDNIEEARIGKEEVFSDVQYGVAIENTSHRGYFSEKILDLILLKTIPIYWGCTNISDFFNKDGIIEFGNVDDLIYITNKLDKDFYNSKKEAIEENYQLALKYVDYEKNITQKVTEIFKYNVLI